MLKYILFIILGIIIYILLNNINRFSIGVPYETETRTFYNPDIPFIRPQDIEYIKWHELESTQPLIFLDGYRENENIPPIYLGRFKKDPESGGLGLGLGWRHFFIIDKNLYYFEEITERGMTFLKPKNYGERDREPIVLISEDQRMATLSLSRPVVYIRAGLVVTERTIGKSYLTITGTDGRDINMYNNIQNVKLAKMIIEQYTQFVISREEAGNITSCSVNIIEKPNYRGIIETPNLTDLITLLESPSITAPEYSIDLSTIIPESRICDSYDSVIKLNLREVRVSDMSSDILVTNMDKSMLPVLEYKGANLIYIETIASGAFGSVLAASNIPYRDFNRTAKEGSVAIALTLKIYKSSPRDPETGQNDPEIRFIESINGEERVLNNCLQEGELINSLIIDTQKENIGKVAIMDIMEDDLYKMVTKEEYNYNVNSTLPLEIIKRICIILICIQNAGYAYTDLKLKNILFKCYRDRKLIISMGDLGSIISLDRQTNQTWSNIPPFQEPGFNNNNAVVWIFGLVIIELYKLAIWDWDNRHEIPTELKILNPRDLWYHGTYETYDSGVRGYFDQVRPAVTHLMGLFDGIKNGTNDIEIDFIKDLLGSIFVRASERITLEGIQEELRMFSQRQMGSQTQMGAEPEPELVEDPCEQYDFNACNSEPQIYECIWDGDQETGNCISR